MTKPALMTFSNFEAINFYFNAKLTDFAMFSYQFHIWLTYCPINTDYETYVYLLPSPHSIVAMVIIRVQSGVILKRAGLLPLKGYLIFLRITNRFYF